MQKNSFFFKTHQEKNHMLRREQPLNACERETTYTCRKKINYTHGSEPRIETPQHMHLTMNLDGVLPN